MESLGFTNPPDRDEIGAVVSEGDPSQIITADLTKPAYGPECEVISNPQNGAPLVVPPARSARRARL